MISTDVNLDDGCLQVILAVVGIAAIVIFSLWQASYTCDVKTRDMGFENRWSYLAGCQIEVESGKWIPLDSYYFKEE